MKKRLLAPILVAAFLLSPVFARPAHAQAIPVAIAHWFIGASLDLGIKISQGVGAVNKIKKAGLMGMVRNIGVSAVETLAFEPVIGCNASSMIQTAKWQEEGTPGDRTCPNPGVSAFSYPGGLKNDDEHNFPHGYFEEDFTDENGDSQTSLIPCCPQANNSSPLTPTSFLPGGMLGLTSLALTGVKDNPPLNLALYVDSVAQDSIIPFAQPPSAYAANISGSLAPDFMGALFESLVLDTWKVVRDICYAATVVVLVAMGFMIMLRTKAGKGTINMMVVFPRVVIGLLLITFSYPIGALSIQLVQVLVSLVVNTFSAAIFQNAASGIGTDSLVNAFIFALGGLFVPGWNILLLVFVALILIALLVLLLSIFITAIARYVKLIVMTIAAPLVFLMYMLPSGDAGLQSWFRGYAANVLAIPGMFAGLMLAALVTSTTLTSAGSIDLTDLNIVSILSVFTSKIILLAMAFIILNGARKIPATLDNLLGAKEWVAKSK